MQTFLEKLELNLTFVGLLITLIIFALFRSDSPWKAAAICAAAVSVIHGILFYVVRAKQRSIRHQHLESISKRVHRLVTERLEVLLLSPDVNDKHWCDAARYTLHDMDREFAAIEAETLRKF
jgi:c-di-AMP phosphodiesterase-like protein